MEIIKQAETETLKKIKAELEEKISDYEITLVFIRAELRIRGELDTIPAPPSAPAS